MLKVNLAGLDRDEARLERTVSADDPFWTGMGVRPAEPLEVDLVARSVGDGVLVRGRLETAVAAECRRCLTPVVRPVRADVDLLFATLGPDEEGMDAEVYPLPARGTELDVSAAVREQILLQVPEYALCREGCRGLCASCGANLNEGACGCVAEPRATPWDALKQARFD